MSRFAEFLDAYAETLARLASELDQLHADLSELRDLVREPRQTPPALERAA